MGLGVLNEGQAALVLCGRSGAPNIVALGVPNICVVVLFGFKGDAKIDVLVGKCPTQWDEPTIAGALNVVACDVDSGGLGGMSGLASLL